MEGNWVRIIGKWTSTLYRAVNYKERSCIEEEFVGCENPFPYKTKRECLRDFCGHGNICEYRKPWHLFTNYYLQSDRCENKCPKDLSAKEPKMLACLQI